MSSSDTHALYFELFETIVKDRRLWRDEVLEFFSLQQSEAFNDFIITSISSRKENTFKIKMNDVAPQPDTNVGFYFGSSQLVSPTSLSYLFSHFLPFLVQNVAESDDSSKSDESEEETSQ